MAALCKVPTKSAGIGLPITAVCKNAGIGQFFCSVGEFFLFAPSHPILLACVKYTVNPYP